MLCGNNEQDFPSGQCTRRMVVVVTKKMSLGVCQLTAVLKLKTHTWSKVEVDKVQLECLHADDVSYRKSE